MFLVQLVLGCFIQSQDPNQPEDSDELGRFGADLRNSRDLGQLDDLGGSLDSITADERVDPHQVEQHGQSGDQVQPEVVAQEVPFFNERERHHLNCIYRHADDGQDGEGLIRSGRKTDDADVVGEESDDGDESDEEGKGHAVQELHDFLNKRMSTVPMGVSPRKSGCLELSLIGRVGLSFFASKFRSQSLTFLSSLLFSITVRFIIKTLAINN